MTETNEHGAQRAGIYHRPENCQFPPRYDLVSPIGLQRLAVTYGEGAEKYGVHNWRQGFSASSLIQHVQCHLEAFKVGDCSEDHLAHAAWGLFTLMHFEREDVAGSPNRSVLFDTAFEPNELLRTEDRHVFRTVSSVSPDTTETPSGVVKQPASRPSRSNKTNR